MKLWEAVCGGEPPETWTVKSNVPTALVTPLMSPLADNVKPDGKFPDTMDQSSDADSEASSCFEYDTLT